MAWEHMRRYRGRAVAGQVALKRIESTGTVYVEVIVEGSRGAEDGLEIRYRGFLNSEKNVNTTVAELRAMGWTGTELGRWTGIGSKEFSFSASLEEGDDGKTYSRACFVRPPQSVGESNVVDAATADLNRRLSSLLSKGARTTAAASPPAPPSVQELDPADVHTDEIPF